MEQLLSFLLVIGILVFVHELGHFLAARWTGMRADVFAIGMGPRMFGWNRHTGFTFGQLPADLDLGGDTDYRVCWLPIGGYVKIIGMVDESFDTEFANRAPAPYEFRSKNALQKTFVLSAGVLMNLLLAFVIFWILPMAKGREDIKTTTIGVVEPGTLAAELDLHRGDKVVSVDGTPVATWDEMLQAIGLDRQTGSRVIELVREGQRLQRTVRSGDVVHALASSGGIGILPLGTQVLLGDVVSYGPADKAGLKKGDVILAIDSIPVGSVTQMQRYIRNHAGKQVTVHVQRKEQTMPVPITVGKDSVIQVALEMRYDGPKQFVQYSPLEALNLAGTEVVRTIGLIFASVGHVISGDVSVRQSFGGPIKIAKLASRSQELGIDVFARFVALISISLAVMNILPLPGLDGGHLMFVGIEAVIRREIPTPIKIRILQIGFVLLLALMAFVIYLDLT